MGRQIKELAEPTLLLLKESVELFEAVIINLRVHSKVGHNSPFGSNFQVSHWKQQTWTTSKGHEKQ